MSLSTISRSRFPPHPPFLGTELKKKKQRKYRTNLIVDTLALIIRLVQNHGVLKAADTVQYGHHQRLSSSNAVLMRGISRWFWNAALIGTWAMHAKLNEQGRKSLVDNFNNPNSSLKVMIITSRTTSSQWGCRATDPDDYEKPKRFGNEEDKLKFYDGYSVEDRNLDSPDGHSWLMINLNSKAFSKI